MNGIALAIAAVTVLTGATLTAGEFFDAGCSVKWGAKNLRVGNALFAREYAVRGGVLRTVSFEAKGGGEWQKRTVEESKREAIDVTVERARWSPVGVDGVRVQVKFGERSVELWLFAEMPGVIAKRSWKDEVIPVHDIDRVWDSLQDDNMALNRSMGEADFIEFRSRHVKAIEATYLDQTDIRDDLICARERLLMDYDWAFGISASTLDCRDVLTGDGMVFVRLAPMPICRPERVDDFILNGNRGVALLANGYPLVELVYCGGEAGRQRAVVAFQRSLRPYRPGRDGVLLSNTWGAGNRDSRINQEFLLKEIDAGAKIGVDVIQIDDGWQHGRTANSSKKENAGKEKVWSGYWDTDPDFWKEDRERFPDGLEFLVGKAKEKGMRFGLWFGPDSSDDAANWKRDADCLLDYHRRLGIGYFKMDSMKLMSRTAIERNRMMFDRMLEFSDGAMVFDLDCTAQVRPGLLGLMDIGPLFLENRYTKSPVYWPHHTLKNLWDLSHLIDPVRLRMEFNNPDTNHENYEGSPLGHGKYRPDALFATVMAASPLAWMELSDVSEASVAALAPLVRRWKEERARWHGGVIHPVANRPDGVAWTGFVSEAADGNGGYALLFRELNECERFTLDLAPIFGTRRLRVDGVIGGRGEATLDGAALLVTVPEKLDFIWVKLGE